MALSKLESWHVLNLADSKRCSGDMPPPPWDLSSASFGHYPLGEVDLSGADLSHANLQMSDLSGANLTTSNLHGAFLQDAWITGASLAEANMSGAKLGGCKLYGSNLSGAELRFADINGANLGRASLCGASLRQAQLIGGNWEAVNFDGATFGSTIFANVDFSTARNLATAKHEGPSTLGLDTIMKSGGNLPDSFLIGCGVPPAVISQIHAIFNSQAANKVFVSYTHEAHDHKQWVERFAYALNARGIYVYFDGWDIAPGDSLTKFMDTGIRESKYGLFICTPQSVARADAESRWTGYEAIQFKTDMVESNKRVIAILRSGNDVPRYLRGRRWVDARDDSEFDQRITEIEDLVKGKSQRPALGVNFVTE